MAGNLAEVVKYRFDESVQKKLLALAWWDWPIGNIRENKMLFRGNASERLGAFLEDVKIEVVCVF